MAAAYVGHHQSFSALALAALGLSATVPTLVAAVFSGTLADRYDRRWLMKIVEGVALAATATLALLLLWKPSSAVGGFGVAHFTIPYWLLLSFPTWAALTAAVTIFRPTFNSALPRLVETRLLGTANGLLYAFTVGVSSGTSVLSGLLVERFGPVPAMLVPLILFGASLVCLFALGPSPMVEPRRGRSFLRDALQGYQYLAVRRELLAVTLGSLAINFLSALAFVELAQYSAFFLGESPAFLGYLYGAGTLGAGAGAFLVTRIPFERHLGRMIGGLTIGMGACVAGFVFTHSPIIALADMFLFGLFPGMIQIAFLAGVQATVPDSILGRVFAADEVGSFSFVPIGQYAGGTLTYATGIESTNLVAGSGMALVGIIMFVAPVVARFRFDPTENARPPSSSAREGEPSSSPTPAGEVLR